MIQKTVAALLIVAILGLTSTTRLSAQNNQTKQEKQAEKVKLKIKKLGLGERVRVKLKLYNDTSYKGYVSQANEDDFVVIDGSGNPNTVKYSDVKSVGGRNLSTGAKIAIGIGIGIGVTFLTLFLIFLSFDD